MARAAHFVIAQDMSINEEKEMKSEKEIRDFLKELEERYSTSSNMNYEKGGAIDALKWVLDGKNPKPVIGHR